MKKPILFVLLSSGIACGAVTTNAVWEVWNTGASSNGGCFDPSVASPGTDHSQQAASQKTYTDLAINGADSTKATSAANPFGATDAGNCYNITGGPGLTVKRVVLVSVSGSVGTFNESLGTVGSTGGQATMGGALDTLTRPTVVAGNTVYVKATGTYTITATQTFSAAGTAGNPIAYIGYTSTRGDNGMVTVQRALGATVNIFAVSGAFRRFYNFIADGGAGGTTIKGFVVTAANVNLINCRATNFTVSGFEAGTGGSNATFQNCWATGGASGATGGFATVSASLTGPAFYGCVATGNSSPGFAIQTNTPGNRILLYRCIAANNTGSTAYDGFKATTASPIALVGCMAYNNGGNGLLIGHATAGDALVVLNSIFVNNGLYGITSDITNYAASGKYPLLLNYNAYYNNNGGGAQRNNVPVGDNTITLTGDPFTNGAGQDFSLNNISGAGAACRGAGFPGALQSGATGFPDIGALQHQDSGVSGGQKGFTFVARGKGRANPDLWPLLHPQFEADVFWPFSPWQTIWPAAGAAIALLLRRGR